MSQIGSPWVTAYNSLVHEGVTAVEDAFARYPVPPQVRSAWAPVPTALEQIRAVAERLVEQATNVVMNRDLTAEARTRLLNDAQEAAKGALTPLADTVRLGCQRTLAALRDASSPQRPEPHDAGQETAILGIKADLQMVLAKADHLSLVSRLGDQLARAIEDGDELRAWVLTTRWPEDYLTSRGDELLIPAWNDVVIRVISETAPETSRGDVRRAYDQVNDPRRGIGSIQYAMNAAMNSVLGEIVTAVQQEAGTATRGGRSMRALTAGLAVA